MVLWHIKHCRLFNVKSSSYMQKKKKKKKKEPDGFDNFNKS